MRYPVVALVDPALSHLDRVFTYSSPDDLELGALVKVPFHGRSKQGVVTALLDEPDIAKPAPIKGVLGPGIGEELVELARWTANRYLSTLAEAIATVVPARTVGEETGQIPTHAYDASESSAIRDYEHADRLDAVIARAHGLLVWRPRATDERAAAIVRACETAVARGRSALVLVPEVRARSETAIALQRRFGDGLARLGADRSARERYREWLALRAGAKRVAVGGRAAVFAPISDLGVIVIDDEAHASYKEGRAPRFHARTVAAERARRAGAPLLLVGVPPSVDARIGAQRRPAVFIAPARSAERAERVPVAVIDVRGTTLTPDARTLAGLSEAIAAGKRGVVIAHRAGTDLAKIAARTFRITGARAPVCLEAGEDLKRLATADCIVASPYIAKDIAVDRVGALAIVDADAALTQPEFRAAEEAFATWWRALRWSPQRVLIETAAPEHPAITALVRWDPDVLARAEASRRRELRYPPFASLARIDVPADRASDVASELGSAGCEILGPAEHDGRTVIIVRASRRDELLSELAPFATRWRATDEPMRVDVDPWEVFVPRWHS